MPDLDPLRLTGQIDFGTLQAGLDNLTKAIEEATEKMKSSFAEASHKVKEASHEAEEGVDSFTGALRRMGTNFYENIHTPFGEIHENFLKFTEELSGSTLAMGAAAGAALILYHELSEISTELGNNARQLLTQSQMFGVSTDQIQVLKHVAEETGTPVQAVTMGMRGLMRVLMQTSDAQLEMGGGNEKLRETLMKYGLESGTAGDRLQKLLGVIKDMEDPMEKQQLLMQLVSTRGIYLLPVLQELAEKGYGNVIKEMDEMGIRLDEQALKTGNEVYQANLKLKESWEGVKNELALAAGPAIATINELMAHGVQHTRDWIAELKEFASSGWNSLKNIAAGMQGTQAGPMTEGQAPADKEKTKGEKERMDELLEVIKRADAVGKTHIVTLQQHAAEIRKFAQEFGENAPVAIQRFVNELGKADEAMVEKFSKALDAEEKKQLETIDKLTENNRKLNKETEKSLFEANKLELDELQKTDKLIIAEKEKLVKDARGLKQEEINFNEAMGKQDVADQIRNADFLLSTKRISAEAAIQMKRKAAQDEEKIERDKVQAELELAKLGANDPVKVQQLNDKLIELKRQYNARYQELDNQLAVAQHQKWVTLFDSIRANFQTSINGFLQGTQTFAQSMTKIFDDILMAFVNMLENMLLQWIEKQVMMMIFGKATQAAAATGKVLSEAAIAGAAAFADMAMLGPEGLAAAPEVAAATEAAVAGTFGPQAAAMKFGGVVPVDNFPIIGHEGEWMLPRPITTGLKKVIANQGDSGGGKSPINVYVQPSFPVHAIDSQDVAEFFDSHRAKLATTISNLVQDRLLRVNP